MHISHTHVLDSLAGGIAPVFTSLVGLFPGGGTGAVVVVVDANEEDDVCAPVISEVDGEEEGGPCRTMIVSPDFKKADSAVLLSSVHNWGGKPVRS